MGKRLREQRHLLLVSPSVAYGLFETVKTDGGDGTVKDGGGLWRLGGGHPPLLGGASSDVASGSAPSPPLCSSPGSSGACWLGDLTVAARAVLGGALGGPAGLGALQTVAFGAAGGVGQRVRASVHHDGVHAVGHGEGLEVGLDGHGQRQLVDEVHRRARHDGPAAQVLQAEHCGGRDALWVTMTTQAHSMNRRSPTRRP